MDLREQLEKLAAERPTQIIGHLEEGSEVSLNIHRGGFAYEIDDLDIYTRFGDPDDNEFYLSIDRALQPRGMAQHVAIFPPSEASEDGTIVAPFSRAIDMGFGECLEKAVLVQLARQKTGSFIVTGELAFQGRVGARYHAYNVVFFDNGPYLVDAQNCVIVRQNGERIDVPYIVPVLGLEDDSFVVPEKWTADRTYSLVRPQQRRSLLDFF